MTNLPLLPDAYPDELWYSQVARYHHSSGNLRRETTFRELFGENDNRYTINPIVTCNRMVSYLSLRNRIDELESYAEKNTLDPFVLRFYLAATKMKFYDLLRTRKRKRNVASVSTPYNQCACLRYCPICDAEDVKKYGEKYWHRNFQIQFMKVCPKHRCLIESSDITFANSSYHLFCANSECYREKPRYESIQDSDILYSRYLDEMLKIPFYPSKYVSKASLAEAFAKNNLAKRKNGITNCAYAELESKLKEQFGEETMNMCFPGAALKNEFSGMVFANVSSCAERMTLLYAFANVETPSTNFESEFDYSQHDEVIEQFLQMSQSGYLWSKMEAAKRIGVSTDTLERISKRTGIKPFWKRIKNRDGVIPDSYSNKRGVYLHADEARKVDERIKKLGVSDTSEYIRYCIHKEMDPFDDSSQQPALPEKE